MIDLIPEDHICKHCGRDKTEVTFSYEFSEANTKKIYIRKICNNCRYKQHMKKKHKEQTKISISKQIHDYFKKTINKYC